MNVERWLSVQEIAAHLGVKTETVYVWVSKKRMPAHKVGRLWKFKVSEVDAWVHSGRAAAEPGRAKTDIGMYDSCHHLCTYCYANTSCKAVENNLQRHNPESEALVS